MFILLNVVIFLFSGFADFEDHINEVYESVSKDVQKISHNEVHQRVEEECQYYSNTNNVYYNKNNLYCTKQSASPHQTQARPPGKAVNKVCEHRLSMDPFGRQDSSHHGLQDEKDRRPKNVWDKNQTWGSRIEFKCVCVPVITWHNASIIDCNDLQWPAMTCTDLQWPEITWKWSKLVKCSLKIYSKPSPVFPASCFVAF